MITFARFGDAAVLVNFEQQIDPAINAQVVALDTVIRRHRWPEVTFLIPAYCSLTIGYDVNQSNYEDLVGKIKDQLERMSPSIENAESRMLHIPVCYDGAFAPDLPDVAEYSSLDQQGIIRIHTGTTYRVYMLGFLPGFAYMGRLPNELQSPRKQTPRLNVPAGSVGLAGLQTGIYPSEAPGGWQLIGRTPLPIFNIDDQTPFLFQAGDQVRFRSISKKEFDLITADVQNRTFQWKDIYA